MNRLMKIILPLMVITLSFAASRYLIQTAPETERKPAKAEKPIVNAVKLITEDYPVTLHSRGTITPATQTALVAEIKGRITTTSPNFRPGSFFQAGEMLLTLDPTDYQYAVTIAQAERSQTVLALEKTRAEATQAKQNWEQLSLSGVPTKLTLYQPQLAEAQAKLAAAEARLAQAERNLERTQIIAPYAGRVLEQQVDLGQFVTVGTPLATLYATDLAEVRLPVTDRQARFMTLPETGYHPQVRLTTSSSDTAWEGTLIRSEATLDPRTQQLYLVAQIPNPYQSHKQRPALKVGQFVRAEIEGITLKNTFRIPRVAVRSGNEVLVVDAEHRLQRREIKVLWQETDQLVISSGVSHGEQVITTSLPYAPNGMQVTVKDEVK